MHAYLTQAHTFFETNKRSAITERTHTSHTHAHFMRHQQEKHNHGAHAYLTHARATDDTGCGLSNALHCDPWDQRACVVGPDWSPYVGTATSGAKIIQQQGLCHNCFKAGGEPCLPPPPASKKRRKIFSIKLCPVGVRRNPPLPG